MNIKYFITPDNTAVSCVGKSGSTAIGKAMLYQLYPDKVPTMLGADSTNAAGWQAFVPKTDDTDTAIVVIRDPVERFRSAVSQTRRTEAVDELLTEIESGGRAATNYHFLPVINYTVANSTLYKFPEHIDDLATAIGLTDIPSVNDNSNNPPKPDLTPEQLARVQAIYADDITLFESITVAGLAYSAPEPVVEPEPVYVPQSVSPAQFRAAINQFAMEDGSDLRDSIEEIIAGADRDTQDKWEYATEIRRDFPLIAVVGTMLALTEFAVDDIFVHAQTL